MKYLSKIHAIKLFKQATGIGFKESKDIIDTKSTVMGGGPYTENLVWAEDFLELLNEQLNKQTPIHEVTEDDVRRWMTNRNNKYAAKAIVIELIHANRLCTEYHESED